MDYTINSMDVTIASVGEPIGGDPPPPDPVPLLDQNNLSDLADADAALDNLDAGKAGKEVFKKETIEAIRDYLGIEDFPFYWPYILLSMMQSYDNVFNGKNRFDITTGKQFEIRKDSQPLNYGTSTASFIIQHRDETDAGFNALRPATVTSIYNDNDGWVDGPQGLSMTIWTGNYTYVTKKGNASAQGYTVGGELKACTDYNELGAFQGVLTNNGSPKGYLSLFEGLVQDSPDGGANAYRTRLATAAFRAAKYHPTGDPSSTIVVSSEGPQPIDAAMLVNNLGNQLYKHFIDARNATITTGQAVVLPNNTSVASQTADKSNTHPILWLDNADCTRLAAGSGQSIYLTGPGPTYDQKLAINTADPLNPVYLVVNGSLQQVTVGLPDSGGPGRRALTVPN